jgi:hypothetical protein
MLAINIDNESEKYLIEILAEEKITSQELVKKLLRNYWTNLKQPQTILERMGGYPEDLLETTEDLSDRDIRKQKISEYLQQKNQSL